MTDSGQLIAFSGASPRLGRGVYVAPGAWLVGDVVLADGVSVWFNAVLRGDINRVEIGAGSNVQDNCTLHVDDDAPCIVGRDVVVGHAAVLHGCRVGDRCLIGMASVLLNGARVGDGAVVAAGCVVPPGREIPAGHLAMGVGAKVVRPLPPDFWDAEPLGAAKYRRLAESYLRGTPWRWPDPAGKIEDAERAASERSDRSARPGSGQGDDRP